MATVLITPNMWLEQSPTRTSYNFLIALTVRKRDQYRLSSDLATRFKNTIFQDWVQPRGHLHTCRNIAHNNLGRGLPFIKWRSIFKQFSKPVIVGTWFILQHFTHYAVNYLYNIVPDKYQYSLTSLVLNCTRKHCDKSSRAYSQCHCI
jgi:hypothetical protein